VPSTIGEHLKKRRLDLGLRQHDIAVLLGVCKGTLENWEQGLNEPEVRFLPAIIGFVGYDPNPEPETFAERIRAARRREGLSQRELARKLGLDPTTVQAWEAGEVRKPYPRFSRLFEEYVEEISRAGEV
jgi:transcriptional regulator with XRE-family HTH domain